MVTELIELSAKVPVIHSSTVAAAIFVIVFFYVLKSGKSNRLNSGCYVGSLCKHCVSFKAEFKDVELY